MPLTPQDVRNKLFTSVRLQRGYNEDEVDAFLDEVEAELVRLHGHIDELEAGGHVTGTEPAVDVEQIRSEMQAAADERLRQALADERARNAAEVASPRAETDAQLKAVSTPPPAAAPPAAGRADAARTAAEQRAGQATAQVADLRAQLDELTARAATQLEQAAQRAESAEQELARLRAARPPAPATARPAPLGPNDPLPPPSPTEDLLRRTLILAQRTADEAIAEARAEAERVVGSAKSEADNVVGSAKTQADKLVGSAKTEAETLVGSAHTEAETLVGSAKTEAQTLVTTAKSRADSLVDEAKVKADAAARAAEAELAERTRRAEAEHREAVERRRVEHEGLAAKLEELRSFERDYRSRLRAYLHLQLRDLEAGTPKPTTALGGLRTAIGTGAVAAEGQPADGAEPAGLEADGKPAAPGVVEHTGADEQLRAAPLYGTPGGDAS